MKKTRIISLLLIVCLLLACAACGGGKTETESGKAETGESTTQAPDETDTEASTEEITESATEAPAETTDTDDETDPAAISEAAMENFLKKLDTCNYVVSGGDGPTTNVVSSEQAYIVYGDEEEYAETFVFMSLNGETFQAVIEGLGDVEEVEFVSTDSVIDCMGDILPNNWMEISGGNMWELFYNDTEKPLEFISTNEYVKRTLGALGGFGQFSLDRMQEVHMILDAKDPQSVHFTAVVEDAPPVIYDDLDLMLEFGKAEDNSKVKQWLEAPVYPDARIAWTRDDIDTLDVVYMRNYGEQILPFPAASSYAMVFDKDAYRDFTGFLLTDAHFTEKDVEDYKEQLLDFGYTEETGTLIDGSTATVYRKLLREEYRAYAQLYLEYDNGLAVLGTLYHDLPEYEGLEAVSAAVQEYGFAALPDTDVLTGWTTRDAAAAITESWAYYFDYDFNITLILDYTDRDSAKAYLEDYKNKLIENGFVDRFNPGEDNGSCATADDLIKFRYTFSEDADTVTVMFNKLKGLTAEETLALLKEHGLPETDIHGDITSRDVTRYYYETGQFIGLHIMIYQPYEHIEDAEAYLDTYVEGLVDQGYLPMDPKRFNCYRTFLYFNEELRKYVAFDLNPNGDGSATLFYEIVSFEAEPDEESIMMKAIRR